MATTPRGIYFPDNMTNANLTAIFATMASSIDDALDFTYDSGWINVSNSQMQNGWTSYNTSGFVFRYRRVGLFVQLNGLIRNGTEQSTIFTMPTRFRPAPSNTVVTGCLTSVSHSGSNSGSKVTRIDVRSSGVMSQYDSVNLGSGWISLYNIRYITQ